MNHDVTNLFVHRSAAQRYAASRPYFHPIIVEHIVALTDAAHFHRVLDVGCGTGHSSRAIAEIADDVVGIDISAEMIAEATPHQRVTYAVAPAEQIPFADESFDLATVGMAFHWFDQPAFLRDVHRVLKPHGWLAIFNNGFVGKMVENERFHAWATETYPLHFPKPARRDYGITSELAAAHGFNLQPVDSFMRTEKMSIETLANYLSTQSNVIAQVEGGQTTLADAVSWIIDQLRPFYDGEPMRTFEFKNNIWLMQRTADS